MTIFAAIFGFRIWSTDVSQAYLQSESNLLRDVYFKPSKEFDLSSGQLLKLLRPLYGLADSGDYWNATFESHIKEYFGMQATAGGMSFFFKKVHQKLSGLLGTYLDDSFLAGDKEFLKLSQKIQQRFESKQREMDNTRLQESTSKRCRTV